MRTQIELTESSAAALAQLEQATGEDSATLVEHAIEQYFATKADEAEIREAIRRSEADFAAGRVYTHDEARAFIHAELQALEDTCK